MFIPAMLLIACSSSDPVADAPAETDVAAAVDGSAEPGSPEPEAAPDAIVAPITCDPGTSPQMADTEKGREFWCDKDGLMHGDFVRLHPDDTKATEGSYVDNLPDGNWIWWHPNGVEETKGKYVKGKQTGSWTIWYDNGARKEEGDYLQGRKQGTWTSWFESGAKSEEGIYHNGMKNALWTYYADSEENNPVRTELWKNGQMAEEKEFPPKKK
jgi:antitoxin component YwqK of YwqJK toxin-antitoxin module